MTVGQRATLLRLSVRCYRVAIRLFPRTFRARFEDPLVETFAEQAAECYDRRGPRGVISLWRKTLQDLIRHAPAERWNTWTRRPLRLSEPKRRRASEGLRISVRLRVWAAALAQDLRFAGRTLAKTPWSSLALVATIALGIGATTAIFTVVHSILFKPLPFADSERVVRLCEVDTRTASMCVSSAVNIGDLAEMSEQLQDVGVARNESFIAGIDTASFPVAGGIVTPGFFDALGLHPALGRGFVNGELDLGSNQVAIISHDFWQQHLHGDPSVLNRELVLNDSRVRIVGVLSADAYVPLLYAVPDVWRPLTASIDDVTERGWRGFLAVGRLRPNATRGSVDAELSGLYAELANAYPEDHEGWAIRTIGLREDVVADYGATLWLFQGAAVCVLLIACANVAALLLVRASTRSREFAVRTSLGAGRGRLFRQLVTESLMLSVAGTVFGLMFAAWTTGAFVRMAPAHVPRLDEVSIDGTVAFLSLALATLTAVVFGIGPARHAWRTDLGEALTGCRVTPPAQRRARSVLVTGQLALAFMLLVGAGLLTRALMQAAAWDPGFDRSGVTVSWMLSPPSTRASLDEAVRVMERARDAVATVPGITAVGLASAGPLFGGVETDMLFVGSSPDDAADAPVVRWYDVDWHYFATLGLAIHRGRAFDATDTSTSPAVAVVNETFARRIFPDTDPIGRRVTAADHTSEIVGVVTDIRPTRPDEATMPEIYWPIRQYRRLAAYLVMRVSADANAIEPAVQARLSDVDAGLEITSFSTLDDIFDRSLVSPRFNMALLALFAIVAIGLAVVGVYGVIAYSVASRTREFGVRLALGSSPSRLVSTAMSGGLTLAAVGLILGVSGALAAGRLLSTWLYGVPPDDPVAFGAALILLTGASLTAAYLPARRASRVDPLITLRAQ